MQGDEGNVSVLTLGWIVLALLALLVMAAASQVHLDRARLASLADEAALAAVHSTDAHGYFPAGASSGNGSASLAVAVDAWLAGDPRPWASEVVVIHVSETADGTVAVELGRTVTPLFELEALGPFNVGIDLEVEGRARVG